jgi:hypothetical protein
MLFLLACAKRPPEPVVYPPVVTRVREDGATEQLVDGNQDGRVDVRNVYTTSGVLLRREVDGNGDGRIDVTTEFDADGIVVRIERDRDLNGTIDVYEVYSEGELRLRAMDADEDGRTDIDEHFLRGVQVDSAR